MVSEYKKIPNTWDLKRIGDLGEIVTGSTPKTNVDEYWDGDIPFVSPTDMKGARYIKDTERTVTYKGAQTGRIIPKNSVMVTCIASIGKLAISSQECITNQQINTIIPHKDYNHEFLYYAISNQVPYLQTLAGTTAVPIINKKTFSDALLPVPPIKEQRKIAAILSSVDEAIEKTEAIIEQTEKVKKGLMQQLLTKGIGHTKFKKTEIGEIPEEWEVKNIGELAEKILGGGTPSREVQNYYKGNIPWATVKDITYYILNTTEEYISDEAVENSATNVIPAGNVIIATRIGLGKVFMNTVDMAINQDLKGIIPKTELIEAEYLLWCLLSKAEKIESMGTGTTVKGIRLEQLKEILLPIPQKSEQKRIVSILNNLEEKIKNERKKHITLLLLKKGLMQVLLTGKVRVKVEDEVMSQ